MEDHFYLRIAMLFTVIFIFSVNVSSQEKKGAEITAGSDFYSSYVWRGTKYGTGPSVQPALKVSAGFISAGAWGSFDFNGYQEADLYFSFALPAGFSLGMTDYYYPDQNYFDYSDTSGSHAFEANLGFNKWGLSLSANYIFNKAGGAGTNGGDKYVEARYSYKSLYLFVGAGDGWHTTNNQDDSDRFTICNLGVGITREIKVTDNFSIPVNGQVILNPDNRKMYIVAGFTL
jgi:hypothetical protein